MKKLVLLALIMGNVLQATDCAPLSPIKDYNRDALKLYQYYLKLNKRHPSHLQPKVKIIVKTLQAIDKNLDEFFPHGPFTREDMIAIAMLESDFHQYEVGTSGERGIFQIMRIHAGPNAWKRIFDVNVNTRVALRVLNEKYQEQGNYKLAIIAYNGIVIRHNKVNEKYWRSFLHFRNIVDEVLWS